MHEKVILFSGGMDSTILAHMYPDALKLYIDLCSAYSRKELQHLPSGVQIDSSLDLGNFERADAIIPARNLFLALIGAQYGNEIMLGATAGDQSRDKDPTWAMLSTKIMRHMFSGKHFNPPRDVRVTLPIKDWTKGELVAEYMKTGGKQFELVNSISCYSPEHLHCGRCKSCLRKWVALEVNRIPSAAIWAHDPADPANWADIIPMLNSAMGWRTTVEDGHTRQVLNDHGWSF